MNTEPLPIANFEPSSPTWPFISIIAILTIDAQNWLHSCPLGLCEGKVKKEQGKIVRGSVRKNEKKELSHGFYESECHGEVSIRVGMYTNW